MTQLILSDEQAHLISAATQPVEIRDGQGNLLGYVSRLPNEEEIAMARQRLASDGPWRTTREVLEHLKSLEQE